MVKISEFERFSRDSWKRRNRDGTNLPVVLYFGRQRPEGYDESGLYIGFQDFLDVRLGWTKEVARTTAFHALVFHFAMQTNPAFYEHARQQLYHNQEDSRYDHFLTRRYFLHTGHLLTYAAENPREGNKIKDFGRFGRELLRQVIFDEEIMPQEPTDAELFGQPVEEAEEF